MGASPPCTRTSLSPPPPSSSTPSSSAYPTQTQYLSTNYATTVFEDKLFRDNSRFATKWCKPFTSCKQKNVRQSNNWLHTCGSGDMQISAMVNPMYYKSMYYKSVTKCCLFEYSYSDQFIQQLIHISMMKKLNFRNKFRFQNFQMLIKFCIR